MAKRIIYRMLDDTTGAEGADEHSFALDGWAYDIDLTDENWAKIRAFLEPYIAASPGRPYRVPMRTGSGPVRPAPSSAGRTVNDPAQNKAIRQWVENHWQAAGLRPPNTNWLAGRGAIPHDYREAYEHHKGLAPRKPQQQQELPAEEPAVEVPAGGPVPAAVFSTVSH